MKELILRVTRYMLSTSSVVHKLAHHIISEDASKSALVVLLFSRITILLATLLSIYFGVVPDSLSIDTCQGANCIGVQQEVTTNNE
jgi:Na+(H+)/acetate symporter ActP